MHFEKCKQLLYSTRKKIEQSLLCFGGAHLFGLFHHCLVNALVLLSIVEWINYRALQSGIFSKEFTYRINDHMLFQNATCKLMDWIGYWFVCATESQPMQLLLFPFHSITIFWMHHLHPKCLSQSIVKRSA